MDLGWQELLIILVIVIVVFGANRLSGIGTALGSSIRDFRRAFRDELPPTSALSPPAADTGATAGGADEAPCR
ncbi:MAG: twin-arginine translocase TatA/TatE family subunit [Chloroflexales bacterium]|nr:twin-arginine translocase TatA/TatE family subunit [Chloroflexales bacterium]